MKKNNGAVIRTVTGINYFITLVVIAVHTTLTDPFCRPGNLPTPALTTR
jgi:hypothetical protein